jgi:hypothetical protein
MKQSVPPQLMDFVIFHPPRVGHNQLQVVSTFGDVVIDEQSINLGFIKVASGPLKDIRMRLGMTDIAPDICLDYAQCEFHQFLLNFI